MKSTRSGTFDYYNLRYQPWKRRFLSKNHAMLHEEGYCWFPFRRASNCALGRHAVQLESSLGLHKLTGVSPWIAFIARKTT